MEENETVETMEETVMEDTPTEVAAPKAEKKNEEQKHTHKLANAVKDVKMLELELAVGTQVEVKGIPMEVVKVDGLRVTMQRKDIVA